MLFYNLCGYYNNNLPQFNIKMAPPAAGYNVKRQTFEMFETFGIRGIRSA